MRDFGVIFSSEKSRIIVVKEAENERDKTWRLGDEVRASKGI